MRIDNNTDATTGTERSAPAPASAAGQDAKSVDYSSNSASNGPDEVALSSANYLVALAKNSPTDVRSTKLAMLSEQVKNGQYTVDAAGVADAIAKAYSVR
jgi:anti-sigma28 factor (negative regulator of flagellin synthesis)